ncbi:MAG: thioredoxin family protein [Myxococcales bacterium]|nr:thioredoxin family protein [Myxococcales bacterium]
MKRLALIAPALLLSCATSGPAAPPAHGSISNLSVAKAGDRFCEHKVPEASCVQCHAELAPKFQAVGDWCGEHATPESQCLICHPDLSFAPLPEVPAGADVKRVSLQGEDVASLGEHAVPGKVTLFDFYADWCAPCRKVDEHVYGLLGRRSDLAVRKLNVVSWETPLAKRHLSDVKSLPYIVVHGRDGKEVGKLGGLDLPALDRLIDQAAQR